MTTHLGGGQDVFHLQEPGNCSTSQPASEFFYNLTAMVVFKHNAFKEDFQKGGLSIPEFCQKATDTFTVDTA